MRPEVKVKREIRLSSAGLIHTYFGEEVNRKILERNSIANPEEELMELITAFRCKGEPKYTSARVSHFNPAWNEAADDAEDVAKCFEKVKAYVGAEFIDKVLYYANRWWPAQAIVEKAVRNRLEKHLYELEGEHGIGGLPKYVIMILARKWRGERDDKLEEISGIEGANFCHQTGFNGGNRTREGTLRMAVTIGEKAPKVTKPPRPTSWWPETCWLRTVSGSTVERVVPHDIPEDDVDLKKIENAIEEPGNGPPPAAGTQLNLQTPLPCHRGVPKRACPAKLSRPFPASGTRSHELVDMDRDRRFFLDRNY
ncbi:hypothetical protein pipiens_010211 [Culex pipiens pipiens]|uniref:Uncharacterized protein n=1 Tax=Culex pipiens pipiens TaxID=38569 RepID=A0ABD1DCP9_CULPP